MSLLDALEFLDFVDVLRRWRFAVPTLVGIGLGVAVYHRGGGTPAALAVAIGLGVVGVIAGMLWQAAYRD